MIDAGAVLSAWEAADAVSGAQRALAMLGADGGADEPLGRRDARLLGLYREIRGPVVDALATCPSCATTLEVHLAVDELLAGYADGHVRRAGDFDADPDVDPDVALDVEVDIDLGSARVRARCPTSSDMLAIAATPTLVAARSALVSRCVQRVTRPDGTAGPLGDDELEELGRQIELADPLVDVRIDILCGECGHGWSALLDVPELVWAQLRGVGRRLLREVDALARRYGWSEDEILALTEQRRHAYLELR